MDDERFERLSRVVGAARTRRDALVAVLSVGATALVARGADAAEVSPESLLIQGCRLPGQRCKKNSTCCGDAARCRQKRCACLDRGQSCTVTTDTPLGPVPVAVHALCCSNKCSKHTNKCR